MSIWCRSFINQASLFCIIVTNPIYNPNHIKNNDVSWKLAFVAKLEQVVVRLALSMVNKQPNCLCHSSLKNYYITLNYLYALQLDVFAVRYSRGKRYLIKSTRTGSDRDLLKAGLTMVSDRGFQLLVLLRRETLNLFFHFPLHWLSVNDISLGAVGFYYTNY